jgi:hypothetical protein
MHFHVIDGFIFCHLVAFVDLPTHGSVLIILGMRCLVSDIICV